MWHLKTDTMRQIIYVLFLFFWGCSSNKIDNKSDNFIINGDLFFKLTDIGGFYHADKEYMDLINVQLDSLRNLDTSKLCRQDKIFVDIFDTLKTRQIINKPYFHLIDKDSKIYTVFVNEEENNKINNFDRQNLIDKKEKVVIELIGQIINIDNYLLIDCKKIASIKLEKGKTKWGK